MERAACWRRARRSLLRPPPLAKLARCCARRSAPCSPPAQYRCMGHSPRAAAICAEIGPRAPARPGRCPSPTPIPLMPSRMPRLSSRQRIPAATLRRGAGRTWGAPRGRGQAHGQPAAGAGDGVRVGGRHAPRQQPLQHPPGRPGSRPARPDDRDESARPASRQRRRGIGHGPRYRPRPARPAGAAGRRPAAAAIHRRPRKPIGRARAARRTGSARRMRPGRLNRLPRNRSAPPLWARRGGGAAAGQGA